MFTDPVHSFYYGALMVSVLLSIVFIKQLRPAFRYLAILIILTFISESTAKFISFVLKGNSNVVYHFFVVIEFGLYALVYHYLFNTKKWSVLLIWCSICLLIAEGGNSLLFQPL